MIVPLAGRASMCPNRGQRSYDERAVDDLLDRIEASLRGQAGVTREELSTVTFPKAPIGKRGYLNEEVDAFIRRVIAEWPMSP
jgi:DivIVA domain-containing protein